MRKSLVIASFIAGITAAGTARASEQVHRESGVISIDGVSLPYLIEGKGETCIVVGIAPNWPSVLSDELKTRLRFIYVDYQRTWTAGPGVDTQNVTMDDLVREVDEVRKAFKLEKSCLISHSGAGFLAMKYALQYPERTSRVILISMPPFDNQFLRDEIRRFWERDASPERKAVLAENIRRVPDTVLATLPTRDAFTVRYTRTAPYYFHNPRYDFFWHFIGRQFSAELAVRFYNKIAWDYDPREELKKTTVPMFIAIGRYDYIVPYYLWDELRESAPNLHIVMFDKSGHFPMIEEPSKFSSEVFSWLKNRGDS